MKGIHSGRSWATSRAFSLVELLVVMAIIAIVIALVLPAIGRARESANRADTLSVCSNLSQAISQFKLDHNGSNPGYFSPVEMGHQENVALGMTTWHNIMLDLMGGAVDPASSAPGVIDRIGPRNTNSIKVDPGVIGGSKSSKAYFNPRAKNFPPVDPSRRLGLQSSSNNNLLPSLVDSWGNPILVWIGDSAVKDWDANPNATPRPGNPTPQPALVSATANERNAVFYWAANAGVLRSSNAGATGVNIAYDSMFGSNTAPVGDTPQIQTLITLLGNPTINNASPAAAPGSIYPTAARGEYFIQSAGQRGQFFSKVRKNEDASGWTGGTQLSYDLGARSTPPRDLALTADDIIVSGGG